MNVNEHVTAVKSNPPQLSKNQLDVEDLSYAEMPEVVVTEFSDEPAASIPAPLTIADVEGGELKPLKAAKKDSLQPKPAEPEVFQVRFKTLEGKLNLLLPAEKKIQREFGQHQGIQKAEQEEVAKLIQMLGNDDQIVGTTDNGLMDLKWEEILTQLEQRMAASGNEWKPRTQVYLQAGDRLLDSRQLQEVFESLQNHKLLLHSVVTNRRQTAINAASMGLCVEQGTVFRELLGFNPIPNAPTDDPLYIKMTVRSGVEIRHSGSIIVFGDVNAGAELISEGDIIVCGKLKGMAQAGSKGNAQSIVLASHLDATQIRIASLIARVESPSTYFSPEVAFVSQQGAPVIQIVQVVDYYSRNRS